MQRNNRQTTTFLVLCILLVFSLMLSVRYGAVDISLREIFSALGNTFSVKGSNNTLNENIFMDIRLPRALLCVWVGASLALGGTLMQGLFRNPIVEPGLVGTSSGAAFGAALYFVIGGSFKINLGEWTLPVAACVGAFLSTFLVFQFARSKDSGKHSIVDLLLTGIAINALFMSGVGFLSYLARDPQARSITFWGLGTLSGANWHAVLIVGASTLLGLLFASGYSKHLNALMIGEEEAQFLGTDVRVIKRNVLVINVIMIAVATAFVGVISFVGLVVPHLLRFLHGADHRYLIRNSAILGAVLLSLADVIARMVIRPAELPIGIVTALVGVPVFLILLKTKKMFN